MCETVRTAVKAPEAKKENKVSQVQKGNLYQPLSSPVEQIFFLQRTIGNQVVQRLMKSGTLQAKLRLGAPGDIYEQEADRMAEQVMRMPQPQAVSSGTPSIQGACPKCENDELKRQPIKEEDEEEKLQRKSVEDEEEKLQTKAASGDISEVNHDIKSHIQSIKGGGQPLSENDRTFFEPRFGHDFSQVRLHTDSRAAESARSLNALAYTVGHDVVFGAGQYSPESGEGKKLIAHELTHVVQQRQTLGFIQMRTTCPNRPRREAALSRRPEGILPVKIVFSESAHHLDILDFAVNSDVIPRNVINSQDWQRAMSFMAGDPTIQIAVTGYTDCVGTHSENLSLRRQRVQAIIDTMRPEVRQKVLFRFTISTTDYLDTNATMEGRARNRSVRISYSSVLTRPGQDPCDLLRRAGNLDEYLFLVRCLERRLNLTSPRDMPTALSVLRQIYYGSAQWSSSRNPIWNSVITGRPWNPGTDPTPMLGPALIGALRASSVVERTDIGHVLTGIDAMMNPQNVTVSMGRFDLETTLANEEWATWAGDVGSAAAESALDSYFSRSRGNSSVYFLDYASDSDLLGDIDSFALRLGFNRGGAPASHLGQAIQLRGSLSEVLLQYYRLSGSTPGRSRTSRIQDFVNAYGGIVTGTTLTNRQDFTARLRPSVDEFARLFSLQRIMSQGNPPPRPPGSPDFSILFNTAVDNMTSNFVEWLVRRL